MVSAEVIADVDADGHFTGLVARRPRSRPVLLVTPMHP